MIDIAATLARRGVILVPQSSAPFRYSGPGYDQEQRTEECARFEEVTGIHLFGNLGIDTTRYEQGWHGVRPRVEIVTFDLPEQHLQTGTTPRPWTAPPEPAQLPLSA